MLKQMRLIYSQGFSKSEKEEWRAIIFNNILSAFKVILDAMEELGIEFDDKENDVSDDFQFNSIPCEGPDLTDELITTPLFNRTMSMVC